MKSRWSRLALLLALGALSLSLLAACSSSDDEGAAEEEATTAAAEASETAARGEAEEMAGPVVVEATEFALAPSVEKTAAGEVTFTLDNKGAIPHELVVIRSDAAPDSLETAQCIAVEDGLDIVGRTSQVAGGATEDLTVNLEAGNYILICNIPAHYETGMRVGFTVE